MTAGLGFGEGLFQTVPLHSRKGQKLFGHLAHLSPNTRVLGFRFQQSHLMQNINIQAGTGTFCFQNVLSQHSENCAQLTTLMLFKYQRGRIQILNNTALQIQLPDGYFLSSASDSAVTKPSVQRPRAHPADLGPHFTADVQASKGTH